MMRSRRAAVNAKQARLSGAGKAWGPCCSLRTKLPGQAIGSGLNGFCPALQRLDGEPPDRAGNTESTHDLARKVLHRNGNAPHFRIELAIVEGNAAPPHFLDLAQQSRDLSYRVVGGRFEVSPLQEGRKLFG